MDYKIPLTQLLGSFRFIMLSPFLFECAHIHRPSQCSEAVLEQLSQITGSKINQTSMDVHHTESYSFQMNLSLSAASSFTAAQWVKLWRWICDWCTAAESHWVKVRPYLCSCSHFLTRQTFFVLIWHAVSFLVRRWNVSAAASQTLNCQLLLVGCKFRFQMIFHRKVKFLWFQCCLHASQTCFNVQPSSSSSQSSESVTCPLERHTVLHLCSRGAHGSTSPLKSVYYSFFASVIFLHLISILIFCFPRVVLIFTVQ